MAERCQQEGEASRSLRHGPSCQVGDEEAAYDVNDDLHQQDGVVVLASKHQEAGGEKSRIARKANPSGARAIGMRKAKDAVVEPIVGNIAVNQRIACNMRESKVEE